MSIYKDIGLLYIFHAISAIVHELGHWFIAKKVYKQYEKVCIGNLFFLKLSKKVKISPIIISGYVSVNQDVILSSSKAKVIAFFGIGPLLNLGLAGIGLLTYMWDRAYIYMTLVNIIHFTFSIIPIEGTDGYNLMRVLLYKSKYDNI